jgi:hypothetical protein
MGNDTGTYYLAQRGNTVRQRNFHNVFRGTLNGNTVTGEFSDVAGSFNVSGPLTLTVRRTPQGGIAYVEKISGDFGATRWTKSCGPWMIQ